MRSRVPILAALLALSLFKAPAGAAEGLPIVVHGLFDLNAHSGSAALQMNGFLVGDTPFDPYRLRIFLEAEVSPTIQVYAQSLLDEYHYELVEGAYAMVTPWKDRDAHLLAGKIPSAVGTWEPRSYSNKNPLIGTPLLYSYYTSLHADAPPADADALLGGAGQGSIYGDAGLGLVIVWDGWWDTGVTIQGSERPFEYTLSAQQGAPSAPEPGYDESPGNSWLGRVGIAPTAGTRFGISGSTGTYLPAFLASAVPPGGSLRDYRQDLLMADGEWQSGRLELRAEAASNAWRTLTLGWLRVRSGYLEARLGLGAASWGAIRAESMRFAKIAGSAGERPWDDNVDRYEAGFGMRLDRRALAKVAAQRNLLYTATGVQTHDLVSAQLSLAF